LSRGKVELKAKKLKVKAIAERLKTGGKGRGALSPLFNTLFVDERIQY